MRRLLALLLLTSIGCTPRAAAPPATGPKSPTGWDVRYNAALALARRGSPQVREPVAWESILEMLDEDQQMRNFTVKRPDGKEVPDETAARMTVIGALKAIQELHRKQPDMDLSELKSPLAKLAESPSLPVRTEARSTQLALAPK